MPDQTLHQSPLPPVQLWPAAEALIKCIVIKFRDGCIENISNVKADRLLLSDHIEETRLWGCKIDCSPHTGTCECDHLWKQVFANIIKCEVRLDEGGPQSKDECPYWKRVIWT